MSKIYFKHDCGLIIDKETHDRIKKKVVLKKFEVTPCPECNQYGGWKLTRKTNDGYEEIKVGKK